MHCAEAGGWPRVASSTVLTDDSYFMGNLATYLYIL